MKMWILSTLSTNKKEYWRKCIKNYCLFETNWAFMHVKKQIWYNWRKRWKLITVEWAVVHFWTVFLGNHCGCCAYLNAAQKVKKSINVRREVQKRDGKYKGELCFFTSVVCEKGSLALRQSRNTLSPSLKWANTVHLICQCKNLISYHK